MPANRSRTAKWRRSLEQLQERNGSLEIAIARHVEDDETPGNHLVWRVRLLALSDSELVVEQPTTLGTTIRIEPGIELVAIFSVGQNRWAFKTKMVGATTQALNNARNVPALRITAPEDVERCQRRNYYRMHTTALHLPVVDVWPLLDPASVVVAERNNELQAKQIAAGEKTSAEIAGRITPADVFMPEVGPKFSATLVNLGGGGVGLKLPHDQAAPFNNHRTFWLRLALPPSLLLPICASAKVTHTHLDSMHQVYAGMAFDFSFNPGHQKFVVEQICQYIAEQQRQQLHRQRIA